MEQQWNKIRASLNWDLFPSLDLMDYKPETKPLIYPHGEDVYECGMNRRFELWIQVHGHVVEFVLSRQHFAEAALLAQVEIRTLRIRRYPIGYRVGSGHGRLASNPVSDRIVRLRGGV
jgi:hypothetical protein